MRLVIIVYFGRGIILDKYQKLFGFCIVLIMMIHCIPCGDFSGLSSQRVSGMSGQVVEILRF